MQDNSLEKKSLEEEQNQSLPDDALILFFQNQEKEIQNRSQEIALQNKELELNCEIAKVNTAALKEDRAEVRQAQADTFKTAGRYFLIFTGLILTFGGFALSTGHKDLLFEGMKLAGIFLGGGGCGYGLKAQKSKKEASSTSDS